jgi:hypothetical protein
VGLVLAELAFSAPAPCVATNVDVAAWRVALVAHVGHTLAPTGLGGASVYNGKSTQWHLVRKLYAGTYAEKI